MIQELKIRNFLSFRDETAFSFEATNDRFADENQVVKIGSTRLLRFAVVYGYNASGKSNLLCALDFLRQFWMYKPKDMDARTGTIPFKLDRTSSGKPSAFELVFFVEDTKYWYQLELDEHQVYLEKLLYYKSNQPTMLFERRWVNGESVIQVNPGAEKISAAAKELIAVNCLKNMSFFVARGQVNVSLPLIDAAKDWMRNRMMPVILPTSRLTNYAERQTSEDKALAAHLVQFLHEADFNITNLTSELVSRHISDDLVRYLTEEDSNNNEQIARERERIRKEKTVREYQTVFEHTVENENGEEAYLMAKDDESAGTLRTFGIEAALSRALQQGAILTVDEMETSLHPKLLEKILFEYLRAKSRTQLLVTTHNDGLLDLADDLIRKDSVWFAEKQRSGVTELYRLTDFRGLNRLSSIRDAYRNKRFGATMR